MDDIVFGLTSPSLNDEFVELMKSEFEMSMVSELTYVLGLQITQERDGEFLCQSKYAKNLVKKFGLEGAKTIRTPVGMNNKLHRDLVGKSTEQKLYRSMIVSLLYLAASKPDISYSMDLCARFQAEPKESHLKGVKRIELEIMMIERVQLVTICLGMWWSACIQGPS